MAKRQYSARARHPKTQKTPKARRVRVTFTCYAKLGEDGLLSESAAVAVAQAIGDPGFRFAPQTLGEDRVFNASIPWVSGTERWTKVHVRQEAA